MCFTANCQFQVSAMRYTFLTNITTANSSANLIQAQRDYFGAHTYQRKEDDTGQFYQTDWNLNEPKKPTEHGNTSN